MITYLGKDGKPVEKAPTLVAGKPITVASTQRVQDELTQVKRDYDQTMRDFAALAKLMSTELDKYQAAVAGTTPPKGAQAAVDTLRAYVAKIPQ